MYPYHCRFGTTYENAPSTSTVLMDVQVQYVADTTCANAYGSDTYVPSLMFCAGVPEGGKDTCQGDSGGPIIMEGTPPVQAGVVSFGIGCGRKEYPGVYARIASVTEWVDQMICELSDFPPAGCPAKEAKTVETGPGKMSIKIIYDDYPKETAFMFVQDNTGKQLVYQPYKTNTVKRKTEVYSFTDLGAGTYSLVLGDEGRDGIW
jgi:Trypsin